MQNSSTAYLFFKAFEKVHLAEATLAEKFITHKQHLNKLFVELSREEKMQFSSRFDQIAFVCHQQKTSKALQWRIAQFRKRARQVIPNQTILEEKIYLDGLKTVFYATASLCQTPVPEHIQAILPEEEESSSEIENLHKLEKEEVLRVLILSIDTEKELLHCQESESYQSILVKYNEVAFNEHFNNTINTIIHTYQGVAAVNLLDVAVKDGIYYPKAIILEPDFLMDVSAISECFQSFGTASELYLLKKFIPFTYSIPLMLGNIANFFLDELMHNPNAAFTKIFPKTFALNPLAFVNFSDREIREIYQKSQRHFSTLQVIVKKTLAEHDIAAKDCYLEPSFYSKKYGIQGRLDIWHNPLDSKKADIIELKSGSPFAPNRSGLSVNHYTQTILYDLLVRSVFGTSVDPKMYILYSKLEINQLKFARPFKTKQNEALNLRNKLLGIEKKLQNLDYYDLNEPNFLDRLCPDSLPKAKGFITRDLRNFASTLENISDLDRLYFMSFVSFVAKENQLAKTGVAGKENLNGLAALWLNNFQEKDDNFEILGHLKVAENKTQEDTPILRFERSEKTNSLANFRQGDIIVSYPYKQEGDNALSNQIFKGSITAIDAKFVSIRLHCKQSNDYLFRQDMYWNIERDMMDSGFKVQYQALYSFLQTAKAKRNLLLTVAAPQKVEKPTVKPFYYLPLVEVQDIFKKENFLNTQAKDLSSEQKKILYKALSAKDYFLLVGPPGTGKTKFMLANIVHYLLSQTNEQILLLAYTNRAVDEICEAIHDFAQKDYIRIGSKYSTDPQYTEQLFSVQTEEIKTRKELSDLIASKRIFVSTVASIANKPSLLKIKKFNTTIIDEASQILEPMLVGILPHFQRFILIGDHKQLPAVVLQDKEKSLVKEPILHRIGLYNRRNSLFERLYNQAQKEGWTWAYDMLHHQGRMHEDISEFPSHYFYDDELLLLPEELPISVWQKAPLDYRLPNKATALETLLATKRMLYFESETNTIKNPKTNPSEAQLVGQTIAAFQRIQEANNLEFDPTKIGVITPFRAQIAQIRHTLSLYEQGYENCTIDTVERYQGGARDIIIISLCMNNSFQMSSVISLSDDEKVDRKLNVALTRARQHLVLIGNRELMYLDERYKNLITWIEKK